MIPLIGYGDRLSARPGETIEFKVSSQGPAPFRADLVRIVSADYGLAAKLSRSLAEWGYEVDVTDDGHYLVLTIWVGTDPKYRVMVKDLRHYYY